MHDEVKSAYLDAWRPDHDRNQSRMVVEKAEEILSGFTDNTYDTLGDCMDFFTEHDSSWGWIFATPEQECQAALMAVREARK